MITQTETVPSEVDYHDQHDIVSASMLKDADESLEAYHGYYVADERRERPRPTREMDVGSVVHSVFLEQQELSKVAGEFPAFCLDKDGGLIGPNTRLYRDYHAGNVEPIQVPDEHLTPSKVISTKKATQEWLASLPDNHKALVPAKYKQLVDSEPAEYLLKRSDIDKCAAIIDKLRTDAGVGQWIDSPGLIREQPIYWTESQHPLFRFRSKPDFLSHGIASNDAIEGVSKGDWVALLYDLKVTAFWKEFWRYSRNQKAKISHAHYMSGVYHAYHPEPLKNPSATDIAKAVKFRYVAVNPEWPHEIATWDCETTDIIHAFQYRDSLLSDIDECHTSGDWRNPASKTIQKLGF